VPAVTLTVAVTAAFPVNTAPLEGPVKQTCSVYAPDVGPLVAHAEEAACTEACPAPKEAGANKSAITITTVKP
jgi:hypothetical protein